MLKISNAFLWVIDLTYFLASFLVFEIFHQLTKCHCWNTSHEALHNEKTTCKKFLTTAKFWSFFYICMVYSACESSGKVWLKKTYPLKSFKFLKKVFSLAKLLSFIFTITKPLLLVVFVVFLFCWLFTKIVSCKKFKSYRFTQTTLPKMSFFGSWKWKPAKVNSLDLV